MDLPKLQPLNIVQVSATPGAKQLDALDRLILIVADTAKGAQLHSLPKSRQILAALRRARSDESQSAEFGLDNARGTIITVATLKHDSEFGLLSRARSLFGHPRLQGRLGLLLAGFNGGERDAIAHAVIAAAQAAAFEMPSFKSGPESRKPPMSLRLFDANPRLALARRKAEAGGNNLARWLTALPPNKLTASSYRQLCQTLAKNHGMRIAFFGEDKLRKLGAGAFLAVAQGNAGSDAGLIHLEYRPAGQANPALALVGKGILFDTGGVNLKPFKGMLDMHTDMQGSAVALATGIALAECNVEFAFDIWLAVTENVISASAYKSQDIVESANGTTIQVIHTDAEGRMVLADTLALAARRKPGMIVDYATLTGACVAALTTRYSGVFSNRERAINELVGAGRNCGERVWGFPLDEDFDEGIKSEVADVKQCATDGSGDHILATRFLKRFVPDHIPWIHMDLSAGQHKGGLAHIPTEITGFGVRYTMHLLLERFGSPAEFCEAVAR